MFADLMDEVSSLATADNVREEFETHFNLGIAYREMALTDDAVKEFQEAARLLDPEKFPRELVQCCGMLSTCYLEKNMPRSAIRWCQTGLNVPDLLADEAMALRYDMGIAHAECGEPDRALDFFQALFGADPAYRDVAQRIDGLRDQGGAATQG